jgi:Tfp pilus assembly protein PilN
VAAVTFSAAAIHSALRLREAAPASLLLYNDNGARREVYGESAARPVYSAEFGGGAERALASSRAELRLAADTMAVPLREALRLTGEAGALAWAAGLVSAAPLTSRLANLIPPSRRASHSRLQYALPAALTVLLLLALVGLFVILPLLDRKRTQALLSEELRRLEPVALRAQSMEKATAAARVRLAALSDVRARTQADLDVLNELSRLLPPQVWASQVEILSDTVTIAGEADQAGPLLRLLDSSPLFQNSEFTISVSRNSPQTELFRIRTMRRGRGGRTAQ